MCVLFVCFFALVAVTGIYHRLLSFDLQSANGGFSGLLGFSLSGLFPFWLPFGSPIGFLFGLPLNQPEEDTLQKTQAQRGSS